MSDMRAAVRRGAQLLDKREPGWRDRIAPGELEMSSCVDCVLGQVFGAYTEATLQLGIVYGSEYGFDAPSSIDDFRDHVAYLAALKNEYDELRDLWIAELKGETT